MEIFVEYIIPFIFGSIVGSFLNVCIFRLPEGHSIVSPGSYCPNCHNSIKFYDNIPVLSFLLLGGKCRKCKHPIPIRYPIVEALAGLVSLALFLKFGLSLSYLTYLVFCFALIVVTFVDLQHRLIPDIISLPGIILGLIASIFLDEITTIDSLIGIAIGGGSLFLVAVGYHLFTKKEGMGGGDIKLLAMIGAFLGWKSVLLTIFIGSALGSLVGLTLMAIAGKDRTYAIPFGPFLAIGAMVYLFWGDIIIRYYLGW